MFLLIEKCIWIWWSANIPCRFQRPPGPIPSSMLGLETVTGSIDHFGFEDCLNGNILCLCSSCSLACFETIDFRLSCVSCMTYWNYGSLAQNLIILISKSRGCCASFSELKWNIIIVLYQYLTRTPQQGFGPFLFI